uniref:GNVR domain-containing protein n=1 Tax=Pseudomonas aeruginosa TaxID=287 RepID=UPI003CF6D936
CFRQDGSVETPDDPIKPRKVLILALGILAGGVLGVLAALLRLLFREKRLDITG